MKIHVRVGGQLRAKAGQETVTVQTQDDSSATLGEVLDNLAEQHAETRDLLLKPDGTIAGGLLVLINDAAAVPGRELALQDGTTITLLSAMSGG